MNDYGSEQSSGKATKVIGIVLLVLLLVIGGLGYGGWRSWKAFVRFGVSSDLTDYQAVISASNLDVQTKRRLTERIDLIRERARDKDIGFFRWLGYDESFKAIVDDRVVTDDEAAILDRELTRLEKEFQ